MRVCYPLSHNGRWPSGGKSGQKGSLAAVVAGWKAYLFSFKSNIFTWKKLTAFVSSPPPSSFQNELVITAPRL